jgi:hypothetical protein
LLRRADFYRISASRRDRFGMRVEITLQGKDSDALPAAVSSAIFV